jgi:hypothetical protein
VPSLKEYLFPYGVVPNSVEGKGGDSNSNFSIDANVDNTDINKFK